MQELITEIQQLRKLVEALLTEQQTSARPPFYTEKPDSPASRYHHLKQLKEEWISDHDLNKYLPNCWHGTGAAC